MGFTLSRFLLSDVVSLSAELPGLATSAASMENAAGAVVRYLRRSFVDPDTGEPEIVLARCYQTVPVGALPPELRAYAGQQVPVPLHDDVPSLTLLGSDGELPEWCDPRRSVGHRTIPLPDHDALAGQPLLARLLDQLGIGFDTLLEGTLSDGALLDGTLLDRAPPDRAPPDRTGPGRGPETAAPGVEVFSVSDAPGSPHIPEQAFVREHGVRSALGLGGVLPGGDVFTVVLFTRVRVDPDVAAMFRTVAVAVKLALLSAVTRPLFDGGVDRTDVRGAVAAARVQALEQMLDVQQRTVAGQAARLEVAVQQSEREQEHARAEVQTTETLREIGTTLAQDLSLDSVVQSATEAATRVTGAAFGAFFYNVVNAAGESYMLYTLAGAPREAFERFPMPGNTAVFEPTFQGRDPVRSDDITRDPRYGLNPPYYGTPPGHLPVRSYLAVPVVSRSGTVHGGLFFGHSKVGVFDERAERLAVGIAAQTAIALDNARLYEQQRHLALELQRSLLQPLPVAAPPGIELAHEYLPGGGGADVGGDWFDVIPLPGGRVALVVGDVMGRGVHAAAIMGQLRTAVRAYTVIDLPPSELVSRFNQLVCDMSEDLIATCTYAIYDQSEQTVTLANAGHMPPALLQPDGDVSFLDVPLGPPLGVRDGGYREHDIAFPPGARLLMFTDGLVEHRGRSIDEGLRQLREWLLCSQGPLHLMCKDAISAVLDPASQDDDVTLLAVGNTGSAPPQESRRFDPSSAAPAQARVFAESVLARWGGGVDPDPVARAVDELVCNAVTHAGTEITLRLRRLPTAIYVEVADLDPHLPRLAQDAATEHQRGIRVVAGLATRWGARPTRTGKAVWAEFAYGR